MRLLRPVLVVVAVVAALAPGGAGAGAAPVDTAAVDTDPTGAHVELRHGDTWVERRRKGAATPTTGCRASLGAARPRRRAAHQRRRATTARSRMEPAPGPEYRRTTCGATTGTSRACGCDRSSSVSIRALIAEQLAARPPVPRGDRRREPRRARPHRARVVVLGRRLLGAPIVDAVDAVRHDGRRRGDADRRPTGTSATARPRNGLGLGAAPPRPVDVVHTLRACAAGADATASGPRSGSTSAGGSTAGPWQTLDPVFRTARPRLPGRRVPRRARRPPLTACRARPRRSRIGQVTHG